MILQTGAHVLLLMTFRTLDALSQSLDECRAVLRRLYPAHDIQSFVLLFHHELLALRDRPAQRSKISQSSPTISETSPLSQEFQSPIPSISISSDDRSLANLEQVPSQDTDWDEERRDLYSIPVEADDVNALSLYVDRQSSYLGASSIKGVESDEVKEWRRQIFVVLDLFEAMSEWSLAARRSREVVGRMFEASVRPVHMMRPAPAMPPQPPYFHTPAPDQKFTFNPTSTFQSTASPFLHTYPTWQHQPTIPHPNMSLHCPAITGSNNANVVWRCEPEMHGNIVLDDHQSIWDLDGMLWGNLPDGLDMPFGGMPGDLDGGGWNCSAAYGVSGGRDNGGGLDMRKAEGG